MKNSNNNPKKYEIGEDATQYGEFISSFFAWNTPEEQRKRTKKLENIANNKENGQRD